MKRALVIIDMQKGFLNKNTAHLERKIAEFVAAANEDPEAPVFDLVIGTSYINHPETACYRFENWKACMSGSEEAEFSPVLAALLSKEPGEDFMIRKDQYTCCTKDLLRLLEGHGIEQTVLCGVNTGCCVLHSALDLYENLHETLILEDLCGSTTGPHYHDIAIELLRTLVTKDRVMTAEEFLEKVTPEMLIRKADALAERAHEGQTDKAGLPYITHPRTVASFLESPEEKIIALLHDTLEDTDLSEKTIRDIFGDRIADRVVCLTRSPEEAYEDYIRRVAEDPLTRAVKLADLKHNSDLTRLPVIGDKDMDRVMKYGNAMRILKKAEQE